MTTTFKPAAFLLFLLSVIICSKQINAQEYQDSYAINKYSFDLYHKTKIEKKNLLLSPLSTYYLLQMLHDGSKKTTKQEIEKVLYLNNNDTLVKSTSNKELNDLESYENLKISNSLWLDNKLELEPGYRECVTEKYNADVKQTDFSNIKVAISDINSWFSDRTNKKINDLINTSSINTNTKMLLANTVYFNGEWQNKFEKKHTKTGIFFSGIENQYHIEFMKKTETLQYFENQEYQFISKPYKNSSLSFCILLPKKLFDIKNVEEHLNADSFDTAINSTNRALTKIYIPKFKLESILNLTETLKSLGLESAFSDEADFSGISQNSTIMLDKVLHKTWLELDEEKTEAAAATATITKITGLPSSHKVFKADHPFVFFIYDNNLNTILFMGRYAEPMNGELLANDKEILLTYLENRKQEKTTVEYHQNKNLIILDKKIITDSEFTAISPGDIESVNLIKDKNEIRKHTSQEYDAIIEITLKKNDKQ